MKNIFLVSLFMPFIWMPVMVFPCDECIESILNQADHYIKLADEATELHYRLYYIGQAEGLNNATFTYFMNHKVVYLEGETMLLEEIDRYQDQIGKD